MKTRYFRVKRYVLISQYNTHLPLYFKTQEEASKHVTKHKNGSKFCYHVDRVSLTTNNKNL